MASNDPHLNSISGRPFPHTEPRVFDFLAGLLSDPLASSLSSGKFLYAPSVPAVAMEPTSPIMKLSRSVILTRQDDWDVVSLSDTTPRSSHSIDELIASATRQPASRSLDRGHRGLHHRDLRSLVAECARSNLDVEAHQDFISWYQKRCHFVSMDDERAFVLCSWSEHQTSIM